MSTVAESDYRISGGSVLRKLIDCGPYLLVVAFFVISHIPFFYNFPLINFPSDWSGYFKATLTLVNGELPGQIALKRGSLFPILAAMIFSLGGGHLAVVSVLSLLRIVSLLLVLYVCSFFGRLMAWTVASALAAFAAYPFVVHVDQMMLPDALFESLEIMSVAFVVGAIATGRRLYWALAGVCAGLAILTKASAIYLLVLMMIAAVVYAIGRGRASVRTASIALLLGLSPMVGAYVSLSAYNYAVNNVFTASAMGVYGWVANTFPMWQTSEQYDPKLNALIEDAQKAYFDCSGDGECVVDMTRREFLRRAQESANIVEADKPPHRGFVSVGVSFAMHELFLPYREKFLPDARSRWGAIARSKGLRTVAFDAIERYPWLYSRKVASQGYLGFYDLYKYSTACNKDGVSNYFPYCYRAMRGRVETYKEKWRNRPWFDGNEELVLGRYADGEFSAAVEGDLTALERDNLSTLPWVKAYEGIVEWYVNPLFNRPVLYTLVWVLPLVGLLGLVSQRSDPRIWRVTIVVGCAGIGVGLLVALVQSIGIRDTVAIRGYQFWATGLAGYLCVNLVLMVWQVVGGKELLGKIVGSRAGLVDRSTDLSE